MAAAAPWRMPVLFAQRQDEELSHSLCQVLHATTPHTAEHSGDPEAPSHLVTLTPPLCTLQDHSLPATVKIQVLSTAYNSTTSEAIVFDSYFTFSHPTAGLSPSQVRVFSTQSDPNTGAPMNTEGSITSVQQVREAPASVAAT